MDLRIKGDKQVVKTCKTPYFARSYFTPNELSGWTDGISYDDSGYEPKEDKKPKLSDLPIMQQNRVLVGQPARKRNL